MKIVLITAFLFGISTNALAQEKFVISQFSEVQQNTRVRQFIDTIRKGKRSLEADRQASSSGANDNPAQYPVYSYTFLGKLENMDVLRARIEKIDGIERVNIQLTDNAQGADGNIMFELDPEDRNADGTERSPLIELKVLLIESGLEPVELTQVDANRLIQTAHVEGQLAEAQQSTEVLIPDAHISGQTTAAPSIDEAHSPGVSPPAVFPGRDDNPAQRPYYFSYAYEGKPKDMDGLRARIEKIDGIEAFTIHHVDKAHGSGGEILFFLDPEDRNADGTERMPLIDLKLLVLEWGLQPIDLTRIDIKP